MPQTPEEIKRGHVQDLFKEILKKKKLSLIPKSISCSETLTPQKTTIAFSFEEISSSKAVIREFSDISGHGFVDCVFRACTEFYAKEYESLNNIELVDLLITPVFNFRMPVSASKANVVLKMKVGPREVCEFKNESDSIISSGYTSILAAFEFYINCEKTFRTLKYLVNDAKSRNRADLVSVYSCKLASLTEMNSYA